MHGHKSLRFELYRYEPKVNKLCRETRSRAEVQMSVERPQDQIPIREELPCLLKEFFILNEYV